jgi:hypothetical protein
MTIDHTRFTIKDRSSRHRSTKAVNKYIWGTSAKLRDVAVPIDTLSRHRPPATVRAAPSLSVGVRSRFRAATAPEEENDPSTSNSLDDEIEPSWFDFE